jgi:hypothetical protein
MNNSIANTSNNKNEQLDKWKAAAYEVKEPLERLPSPLHVMTGEAVEVGWFCREYWQPELDDKGIELRPGLVTAHRPGLFEPEIADEVLELQLALQAANGEYLLASQRAPDATMDRARTVLGEVKAILTFMVDDETDDIEDERLSRLAAQYEDAASQDAVASALDDYATFAELHKDRIDGLGGFDLSLIDEARRLAKELREVSAKKVVGTPPGAHRAALDLRNRVATLLHDRVRKVRAVSRYVFRQQPDLVRRVTSDYQRRRRTNARRSSGTETTTEASGEAV